MKFVMQRNRVISSVYGHAVEFIKGVPTHVPPALYDEVMAVGAVPVEALPDDEPGTPVTLTPDERKALLQDAIEAIVLKNESQDFTAGNMPHAKVLSAKVGFTVDAGERDAAWAAFQANAAT